MRRVILLLLIWSGWALPSNYPPEIIALQDYLLHQDYPELFGDKAYRLEIRNILISDVDGDGYTEMVVHYQPHYRQSPTIVFYQLSGNFEVTRVIEGLAPGKLVPVSKQYNDSHMVGSGIDFTGSDSTGSSSFTRETLVKFLQLNGFGNYVLYQNFVHVDGRSHTSGPTFVDMEHLIQSEDTVDCEYFEFEPVREISMAVADGIQYLAAWVGSQLYLYHIAGFTEQGLIDKEWAEYSVPNDFSGFVSGETIELVNQDQSLLLEAL